MKKNLFLSDDIVKQLNNVLPLQLMAVQQHFIHVIILKCWGAHEISQGIITIDEVDLPNAMKIVDLLVKFGNPPEIGFSLQSQLDQMPAAGNSYTNIFTAERFIEKRLVCALSEAKRLLNDVDCDSVSRLIAVPLSARADFEVWMKSQEENGLPNNYPNIILPEIELASLNHYFAHLVLLINQEMIHSFIHWNEGKKELADSAWEVSGGAMMQATEITKALAKYRLSPKPMSLQSSIPLPQKIAHDSDQALRSRFELTLKSAESAEKAKIQLQGTEFQSICAKGENYFNQVAMSKAGLTIPYIGNPCVDFERVMRSYVWDSEMALYSTPS